MKVQAWREAPEETITGGEMKGVHLRIVAGPREGAKNFVMRVFELEPDGHTPRHSHPWEHEAFILSGRGILRGAEGDRELQPGDAVFIPGGEDHQFRNSGKQPLQFICVIPAGK